MTDTSQKLSFVEKAGYSAADSAANFVFMTMILFQLNFYTDTFGLTASAAAAILLWPRLWDALFDPIMGIIADRTKTRWGKFRPWILWTAIPWAVVMVLAYTTPKGWNMTSLIIYAAVTNTMLMTLYSMNNMPYSALGGVMTGNLVERAKLNSYRFIAVNIAQFIVGGFTLPLVAKFAAGHDRAYGWQMTMMIWAALCLVLFTITFLTTRERIQPPPEQKVSAKADFAALIKNNPWKVMFVMTLIHFAILSFRGGALYNYYHHYADRAAMYEFVQKIGLTSTADVPPGGIFGTLGYIVHGDRANLATSNVADVFNSIVNMIGTGTTIIVILLSPGLARRFGKKAVAVWGFGLAALGTFAFYLLPPTSTGGMVALTILIAIFYAPTIPLVWAIFADVADYSEWKTGRRFTGTVFATIGFALKSGLALGSAAFLWLMAGLFGYDSQGTPLFTTGDVNTIASLKQVQELADKVKSSPDPVSVYVRENLSPETQQALTDFPSTTSPAEIENLLVNDLNRIIASPSLYTAERFTDVTLRTKTTELIEKERPKEYDILSLNRLLLEDAYPAEISRQHNQPAKAREGFRVQSGISVGLLFAICTVLLMIYQLNKRTTIQMAEELEQRRKGLSARPA